MSPDNERAKVVDWLRLRASEARLEYDTAEPGPVAIAFGAIRSNLLKVADAIERGDHLKPGD